MNDFKRSFWEGGSSQGCATKIGLAYKNVWCNETFEGNAILNQRFESKGLPIVELRQRVIL